MELIIDRNRRKYTMEFWLIDDNANYNINYQLDNQTGNLMEFRWPNGEVHPDESRPFLELPMEIGEQFIEAVVKQADGMGKKVESTHKLEGLVEAQKAELGETRWLLKEATSAAFDALRALATSGRERDIDQDATLKPEIIHTGPR